MKFITGIVVGLVPCLCMWIYLQLVYLDLEGQIRDAKEEAQTANETRDNLLSNGRFVRVFDPKRNLNYYTFKPFVTDFKYGVEPKFVALRGK